MPRQKQAVLEYRSYDLPADFPLLLLSGEHWRISPVPSHRLHIHNCLEIGLCLSDGGEMILGDQRRSFHSGYVTCIARNVPHTTWSSQGTRSLWSYLYVEPEVLLGRYGLSQVPDLQAFNRMLSTCRVLLPPEQYPWAMPLVQEIMREFTDQPPGYRVCIRGLFLALLIRLLRLPENNSDKTKDKNLSALTPALDYVYNHFSQTFPLENLAEVCHMSPTHFRRLFHAQMGTNPLNFLHQVRILKSCTLLRASEKNVSEIASQVGYTSLSCYNMHFQRIMGCTPSAWRKSGGKSRPSLLSFTGWLEAEILDGVNETEG